MYTDCAKGILTSNWRGFSSKQTEQYSVKYYLNKNVVPEGYAWIRTIDIPRNKEYVNSHKVYIPQVGGSGTDQIILGKPFYGEPGSVCSETYICIGSSYDYTKQNSENIISYIKTRFFRYLVSIKKKTHHAEKQVYEFVPVQDFSKGWTDFELYVKYNLSFDEIDYIESKVKPMGEDALFNTDELINPEFA